MRVTVFGAGAIGGHLAFRLARGGADVSVIGRGAHLAAIRQNGLTVRAADASATVAVRATDNAGSLGRQDAVVVTVKAPSLPGVAAAIAPLLGPDTAVAFVMNGVPWWYFHAHGGPEDGRRLPLLDPGDALWRAVGPQRVIGGVVYSACEVTAPGTVTVENPGSRVILGEPDGSASDRVAALAAAIRAGGMGGETTDDIRSAVWAKWLGNIIGGPIAILSRQPIGVPMADPVLRAHAARMLAEAATIPAALGRPIAVDIEARLAARGISRHKPSILQDLERGRAMEVDALFTVPLAMGRAAGADTPTLDVMVALVKQAARAAGLYGA